MAAKQPEKRKTRTLSNSTVAWITVAAYAVVALFLFRAFVFSDRMLFGTDTMAAGVFTRSVAARCVAAHGTLPMWDPYIFCGLPFVDAGHGDTFHPFSLLQYVLPLHRGLGWKLVLTVFAAGVFMRGFLRKLGLGPHASSVGGLMYMLSATLVTFVYAGHDGKMYAIAATPLALWALEHFLERATWTRAFLWSLAYAFVIYSGHLQMAYYATWLIAAYAVYRLISAWRSAKSARPAAVALGKLAAGVAAALLLCATFASMYVYVAKYSPRAEGEKGLEWASSWNFGAEEVAALVVPEWVGDSVEKNTYWGSNAFKINSEYAGFVPLLFALVWLVHKRDGRSWLLLGVAAFAVLFAMGKNTPLFAVFYSILPGLKSMRSPSMIAFVYALPTIALAAFGLQWAMDELPGTSDAKWRRGKMVLVSIAGFFAVLALWSTFTGGGPARLWADALHGRMAQQRAVALSADLSRITVGLWFTAAIAFASWVLCELLRRRALKPTAFAVGVGLIVVVDLWRIDSRFIQTIQYPGPFARDAVASHLSSVAGGGRVLDLGTHNQNYFALQGVEEVAGHHGNQLRVVDALLGGPAFDNLFTNGNVMDLTSTAYVVSARPLSGPRFSLVRSFGQVSIYLNNAALPRAFVAYRWEVVSDPDAQLARVLSPEFDPRERVILSADPGFAPDAAERLPTVARLSGDGLLSYTIDATLAAPGVLVVSNGYYPAWRVHDGGREVPLLVANSAFWGIPLEPGDHHLTVKFDSPAYSKGVRLAEATLLGVLAFFAVVYVRGKRKA